MSVTSPAVPEPHRLPTPDRSRVTVVVPTYNRREQLLRCVHGILACDTTGLEVHLRIVDDGSPDDTPEAVAGLQREYGGPVRLHYHRQENGGQSAARNTAIAASDTDLILFIDDDCQPETGWIQALVRAPWEDGLGAVGGKLVAASQDNVVSRYCRYVRCNEYPPAGKEAAERLHFVNSANCAYRRQALVEVGGYELRMPRLVDQDLGRRLQQAGYGLGYVPDGVVHHFHRESAEVLARDYYKRGYSAILRNVLWETELPITPERVASERRTLQRRGAREYLLLPFRALGLVRKGVAPGDALSFAYFDWLEWVNGRRGKIAAFEAILAGTQPTARAPRPWPPPGEPATR